MTYHNSKRSRPRPASDANASNRAAWLKFQSQMERGQQEPLQVWEDEGGSLNYSNGGERHNGVLP